MICTICFACISQIGISQKGQTLPSTPTCDKVLPTVKKEAQDEANQTCSTITTCTECIDKATKIKINAVQVIQPTCDGASTIDEVNSSQAVSYKKQRFNYDILQSPCTKEGTSLEIYMPGLNNRVDKNKYSYMWEVDGKKAGHEKAINCVCGNVVTVKVTELKSGFSISKKATLKRCNVSKQ